MAMQELRRSSNAFSGYKSFDIKDRDTKVGSSNKIIRGYRNNKEDCVDHVSTDTKISVKKTMAPKLLALTKLAANPNCLQQ